MPGALDRKIVVVIAGVAALFLLLVRFTVLAPAAEEKKVAPAQPRRARQGRRERARAPRRVWLGNIAASRPFPHLTGATQNDVWKLSQNQTYNDKNLLHWLKRLQTIGAHDPLSRIGNVDEECVKTTEKQSKKVDTEEEAKRETLRQKGTLNPRYTRHYFNPLSASGDEGVVSDAHQEARSKYEPPAMCKMVETVANPNLFRDLEDAASPKPWEYYVRGAGQCSVNKRLQCDTPTAEAELYSNVSNNAKAAEEAKNRESNHRFKDPELGSPFSAKERHVKGRALVMIMISSFDPLVRTPEWENIDYFLRLAMLHSKVQTELYDGVDYVFYRIHGDAKVVTLCKARQNVRTLWVPPGPCDLCTHGRVLRYLGFRPEYSTKLPHFSLWPYKTVVLANSGVRGPFTSEKSGEWIDVVSMAGQPSRPKYFFDDLSFTTVAGVHVDPGNPDGQDSAGFHWDIPWHLQSYFLMVPISSLSYFFRLYDEDTACVTPSKQECIFVSEVKSVYPFVEQCKNKLWLGPVDERRFQIHSLAWDFTFSAKDNVTEMTEKYKLKELQAEGYMVDPCKAVFVKFGGNVFRMLNNEFRLAVSVLSRHRSLVLASDRQRMLDPGLVNVLFGRPTSVNKTNSKLLDPWIEAKPDLWRRKKYTQCNIFY